MTSQLAYKSTATDLPPALAEAGFILTPNAGRIAQFKAQAKGLTDRLPALVGYIPNRSEFSSGPNIGGAMYIIKQEGSDQCLLPARDQAFLATVQDMIDREYALGDARKLVFGLRPSRHTAAAGEAHQKHAPDWHDHRYLGTHRAQIAADYHGTQFKLAGQEVATPNGGVSLFNEQTRHRTPTVAIETRRTFLGFVALEPLKAYRQLQGPEHQSPLDRLLIAQSQLRYDETALNEHWRNRAQTVLAKQQKRRAPLAIPRGQFIALG